MSMTTSHPTATGHWWNGPAGLLMTAGLVVAVASASFVVGRRTATESEDGPTRAADAIAAPARDFAAPSLATSVTPAASGLIAGAVGELGQPALGALAIEIRDQTQGLPGLVAGAVGQLGQPGGTAPAIDSRGVTPEGLAGLVTGTVGQFGEPNVTPPALDVSGYPLQALAGLIDGAVGMLGEG
jgi:hypothetical protein